MTALINRYQPTKLEQKLYTAPRAARILGIKTNQVEFVYPCNDGCLVGLFNDSIFIKKVEFVKLMAGDRQNRSKSLIVTPNAFDDTAYTVRNEDKETTYRVETYQGHMSCSCKDYENLSNDFNTPKVSCKHIYAVLNQLGCTDLREYIESNKAEKDYQEREEIRHLAYN
jgi:hypothetical protein